MIIIYQVTIDDEYTSQCRTLNGVKRIIKANKGHKIDVVMLQGNYYKDYGFDGSYAGTLDPLTLKDKGF